MIEEKKTHYVRDYIKIILGALFLSLLVRTFLFQPFTIPSSSMVPTLQVGDYLFVSKYSYGYSRFSLPFDLPFIKDRLFFKQPAYGDVVVFRSVDNTKIDYVKRVVGLEGDLIQMKEGILYINKKPVERKVIGQSFFEHQDGMPSHALHYEEKLTNDLAFLTLKFRKNGPLDNTPPVHVPKGHFFVLGDNRDNSSDSRVFGCVPFQNLVGKARFILFSEDDEKGAFWKIWTWPHYIRWHRIFYPIT